jgi:co-chaperonin GroES (HSP10)
MLKKVIGNWILVRPHYNEQVGNLLIDTSYEDEKYAPVSGEVVMIPDALVTELMDWETQLDVKVGDTVYFHFLGSFNAMKGENRTITINGETLLFIGYPSIFAAKTDGALRGVNGYSLMSPVENKDNLLMDDLTKTYSNSLGNVVCESAPNLSYTYKGYSDSNKVMVGDIALLNKHCTTFVCNPIFYQSKEESFFRAQLKDIIATFES